MLRGRGTTNDGRPVILLGLERGNIERLQDGQPIRIDATELGFAGEILIVYGETADQLAAQIAPDITPEDRR